MGDLLTDEVLAEIVARGQKRQAAAARVAEVSRQTEAAGGALSWPAKRLLSDALSDARGRENQEFEHLLALLGDDGALALAEDLLACRAALRRLEWVAYEVCYDADGQACPECEAPKFVDRDGDYEASRQAGEFLVTLLARREIASRHERERIYDEEYERLRPPFGPHKPGCTLKARIP